MNMRPATPLEAQRMARSVLAIDRARLGSSLRGIAREEGFQRAVEAVHAELRSVAAEMREEGYDLGNWIG